MRMSLDFSGKVALVTGASEGIGARTAELFADHGADLVLAARRPDKLADRAAAIGAHTGRRVLAVPTDVADADQVEALVAAALCEFGGLDILINNAGGSARSSLSRLTAQSWRDGRAINLDSVAYCTLAVGRHFRERGGGVIVNLSSVAGLNGTRGEIAYSAAKAGVQMFTRVAAAEWGPHGVRVNCVAPGMTATEGMRRRAESGVYDLATITKGFPLQRAGTMEDVAYAILFLASDYAAYITGQTLAVDGGPVLRGLSD